jgi:hypothetical protein
MIEIVFTLDYEIFGNGRGALLDFVYRPAEQLKNIFRKHGVPFVVFVEVAEIEIIDAHGGDPAVDSLKRQLRDFRAKDIELGLHLHPQWYNARYDKSGWQLDSREYNLCALSSDRINRIIERSLSYLRKVLEDPGFTPFSFRAGNWLLQPAREVAKSLAEHGIRVDSSVYKGGVQHEHNLDYRRSLQNGYYWRFSEDVNVPDPRGVLLEIPTYTQMVPIWNILTAKRIRLQQQGAAGKTPRHQKVSQLRDCMRPVYPMKLDFCRLTSAEMIRMFDQEIQKDLRDSSLFRPIVAIGHTKDFANSATVEAFLSYLKENDIPVVTFEEAYAKITRLDERS